MEKIGSYTNEALEYLAKLADGGMRDAISMMDKCLSYSQELTLDNVVKALGTVDYETMFNLTSAVIKHQSKEAIEIIEGIHAEGKDLKQFIKSYSQFLIDIQKVSIGCDWNYITIPDIEIYHRWFDVRSSKDLDRCMSWLDVIVKLNANIKYSLAVKYDIEAAILCFVMEE